MKSVHLIPEIQLLVIFNKSTGETIPIKLPASSILALAEEFEEAVLHLSQPPKFQVIEPSHT